MTDKIWQGCDYVATQTPYNSYAVVCWNRNTNELSFFKNYGSYFMDRTTAYGRAAQWDKDYEHMSYMVIRVDER